MIWSNIDLDLKDWEGLREEHPEYTEEQLTEEMYEVNNDYLSDERYNLKIQCGNDIIVFGNIGRWNGRAHGYKLIESGNIADCLYTDCDMADGTLTETEICVRHRYTTMERTICITASSRTDFLRTIKRTSLISSMRAKPRRRILTV